MLYYRAKGEYTDWLNKRTTVTNELYTQKERDKKVRYLPDRCFEKVEISSRKTFWMFGARFEVH